MRALPAFTLFLSESPRAGYTPAPTPPPLTPSHRSHTMVATISGGGMRNAWDGPTILQVCRGRREKGRSPCMRARGRARFPYYLFLAHDAPPLSSSPQSFLTIVEVIMICAFGAILAHVVSFFAWVGGWVESRRPSGGRMRLERAAPAMAPPLSSLPRLPRHTTHLASCPRRRGSEAWLCLRGKAEVEKRWHQPVAKAESWLEAAERRFFSLSSRRGRIVRRGLGHAPPATLGAAALPLANAG